MIVGIAGKKQSGKDLTVRMWQYLVFNSIVKDDWGMQEFLDEFHSPARTALGLSPNMVSGWEHRWFAEPLKDIVCILLGCTREQLEDNAFKEKELGEEWWYYKQTAGPGGPKLWPYNKEDNMPSKAIFKLTPRRLLQLIGTECGRQIIHPNIWINALMKDYRDDIKHLEGRYPNWVISDVRFPNEVKAIKDRGGIVIRLHRDLKLRQPELWLEYTNSPISSSQLTFEKFIMLEYPDAWSSIIHESEIALDNYFDFDYHIDNNGSQEELLEKIKPILQDLKII